MYDSSRDCFSNVSIRTVERRRPAPKRAPRYKVVACVALIADALPIVTPARSEGADSIRSRGPDPGEIISDW